MNKRMRRGTLSFEIDKLAPCLEDSDGNLLETAVYEITDKRILKGFTKRSGWYANWSRLYEEFSIFALVLKNNPLEIQGLVAVWNDVEAGVTLIQWAVAAPHNNPKLCTKKRYEGVGGHLFAIALYESLKAGFGGVVVGHPSNRKLYNHYQQKLKAKPFDRSALARGYQYTIVLQGMDARYVYEKYDFEFYNESKERGHL